MATTAAWVNAVLKPLGRRRRPDRDAHPAPAARQIRMPRSSSFPSGHSATAFAFATGVASVLPLTALPLQALAVSVAYSRVHTGVHYPGDVLVGAVAGTVTAHVTIRALNRRR